ncbi:putative ribonuclease H-like domain-containing protein [Tanacetum coccineum]|uniref:Ribonuclease H-like domain-containing protein n=1 Tax=Tanacetum coccineum TaxID=301880 RepID=A0ABQ5DM22_9ASTR
MNPDKQDTSSSLENYTTHDVDANIRPVNDEEPFAEVQLTAHTIMLASEQQHTEQSEPSYDTYLIGIDQGFLSNKSSAVHEKPHTPRSCLRWKPMGRIFKTVSLRWIPTGKMFTDRTTKVDNMDGQKEKYSWHLNHYKIEFLAEDAQARKRFEEEQASERLVQRLRAEDLAQEDLQHVSEERAKELDDLMMRMTETDWLNLMMQVGSNPALAKELLGADVHDAHNGTITMKDVKAMNQKQLVEEYEYICRRLEKDRLLSAQYNLFRPKPAITEPPSKRQRVEHATSQPASVLAATTHTADDPDSAGGGSSNPAGSATPMAGSAASNTAGGTFDATGIDSTVTTTAAMDSAGSRREIGVSPFADSAASSSPSNVSIDHIPIDVLFESTSGGILEFFLENQLLSCLNSKSGDLNEGKSNSSDGVVLCSKATDDEIVDHGFKGNGAESTLTYLKELLPKFYPIRATLLERMLRHRLTVPPSYCWDVVVAGHIIQTVQAGLRQAYEAIASAPIACTARQMVFSSPWLTAKKESGSPLQTALVCNSNPLIALASPEQTATGKDMSNPLYGCDGLPKTVRLLFFDVATSFDSAVHRVHVVSFDAAVLDVAATVSAACINAVGHIVSAGIYDAAGSSVLAVFINIGSSSCVSADYVPAGHLIHNIQIFSIKYGQYPHQGAKISLLFIASNHHILINLFKVFSLISPTFTQTAFSQPAFSQPNQSIFSQPAVHFQQTQPTQTQQYPNNVQSQQFQQFQTASISANNAKFPYLEKDKYEIWAMKMEYWIQNADHNLWRIVQQGNSPKRLGKDAKGNTIVHPPVSLDEHVAVQRENKVRTLLLQALPEDHMPDFHHYDDARDIWIAVKARFGGNEESKKMRKTMLKQQFTEFSVTEEEGLHKGYDRFQKILSQLNQVQARPDNDDINLKFLRALPSSWSQVALALKTRGGLESMSFDDLYNKLRSLELDVRIGHSYGVKAAAAPTHSAFIGAASSRSKSTYSDQQNIVSSVSQTSGRSDNIMECVLHSFVAENEPDQDMIYEDFDQVDQLEMEELDLKWQMAMLSLRINRFEKKAGRKMNYNNQQPARFDRRKVRCYKCLQLGHFARECNVKTVDDKARYSAFKVTEVKTDEPKALVSVDSMVNWSDHAAENKTGEVEKVYGMMAGLHADNGGAGVSDAAAEFGMMGISPKVQNCPLGCDSKINDLNNMYNNLDRLYNDCYIKVQAYQNAVKTLESQKDWYHKTQIALEEKIRILSANLENTTNTLSYTEKLHDQAQKEKKEWEVKFEATLARFEKWKESSKNLKKLINSSMSTRTKIGLGFKEYFGKDEVFDLSTPSVMYPEPVEEVKPLYSWFVKAGEMHAVPPSITGTYMPTPYKSDIEETQVSYGSKSDNKTSETLSESNDFVSCDNSDKSSDSETYASCDSSLKTKTKDFPPAVDIKTLPESDVEDPNSTAGSPSFSCLENVKSPRIFCNKSGMNNRNVCKNNSVRVKKCFVCGSKLHLIKDCDFYQCVDSVPCKSKAASLPAGSRNSPASDTAGGSDPAASRNRPAVNSAGRPVSAGWLNPAARPYFRPSSVYFNNMNWPNLYDPMYMNKGRWGTAGDPSTDNDIGSGYQQKDRKPSQNDKTEHGMEKTVQNQGQSPKMSKSESILKNQQSNRSRN